VDLVRTGVSEEYVGTIFRLENIHKLGTLDIDVVGYIDIL
jgi:hypothetical protein